MPSETPLSAFENRLQNFLHAKLYADILTAPHKRLSPLHHLLQGTDRSHKFPSNYQSLIHEGTRVFQHLKKTGSTLHDRKNLLRLPGT
jgi:hypothetical protein